MQTFTNIESIYSNSVSLEHRKKFAQYFTPTTIAQIMSKWLLGNESLKTVLEPAFGLGIFSRILLTQKADLSIKGFEIDDLIFQRAQKEFSETDKVSILLEDYMYNDWENKYDGIICNPPYFKLHDYDNKTVLKEIEHKLKCKLNGFTNLDTLFLLKSIHQLNPNGRCAYIIPAEFLNSDYGKLVKKYLIKTGTLRHIIVFDFQENVFNDALTTASIILCANDNITDKVIFTSLNTTTDLPKIEQLISNYPENSEITQTYKIQELNPTVKWKSYYQIWVSVFNRAGLRFVRNNTQALNLTTFHCVYPQENLFSDISEDLLCAYLITPIARQIFEDNSREYGNGLQKFEPNDLNNGKMLDLNKLTAINKLKIENLYACYKNNHDDHLIDEINTIFMEEFAN